MTRDEIEQFLRYNLKVGDIQALAASKVLHRKMVEAQITIGFSVFIGVLIGAFTVDLVNTDIWHNEAVAHSCAEYVLNAEDGSVKWEWKK